MDIKGENDNYTVIIGDFNTSFTSMDRSRQKINKETAALNEKLEQMDLIEILRVFHHKAAEYTYTHGIFYMIYNMLGHKTSLSKFKKTEIISSIFSDCNGMNLEIN